MNELEPATTSLRRAKSHDAFAVAAMFLQHDLASGAAAEPGFLDRFADFWLRHGAGFPTWLALRDDGDPAGVLVTHAITEPPRPGRRAADVLDVTLLHVTRNAPDDVAATLVSQGRSWCAQRRLAGVRAAVRPGVDDAYVRCGFTREGGLWRWWAPLP